MIIKKLLILLLAGLAILLLASGCKAKPSTLNTAGSTTVLPIVQAAAEAYMDQHPQINISVRGGGSSIGIKSAINETIDIGNASRRVNALESELVDKMGRILIETPIAKDAISIIVHKSNSVKNLSMEQLKRIYLGEINNWQEVGGKDMKIIVVSRDISSGSFEVFNSVVLDSTRVRRDAMKLASNNAVATTVGYTPGAVGYIGLGYVNEEVNVLAIEGVMPSQQSARDDSYKLSRLLYMYTSENPKQLAQDFIAFILSKAGQQIVVEQGFVRID